MTNIQRYSLAVAYDRNDNANIESYEDGLGKWIKHSDHVKAMEEYARLKSQEENKDVNELNDKQVKIIQGLNKELAAEMIAVKELVEALRESNLQIEYLQRKFQYTGSGNSVISRNESIIAKHTKG